MSWLEFFAAVIQALAWPGAIGFSVWFLRDEVRKSFSRVISVGPDGIKLEPGPQQLPKHSDDEVEKLANQEITPLQLTFLADLEERYKNDLNVFPKEKRESVLLRALTMQTYYKDLMLIYADIYGSQIEALEILNERKVLKSEAQAMLQELGKRIPFHEGSSLNDFMGYLLLTNMIVDENGIYTITQKGRDFLTFLTASGLSKRRPL